MGINMEKITLDVGFITGVGLGLELFNDEDPEIKWAFTVDLLIVRLALIHWKN
jgi:hypothetical protein